jgi:hypothetical protein
MRYQVPRISTFEQISGPRTQLPDPQSNAHFVERSQPGGRRPGTQREHAAGAGSLGGDQGNHGGVRRDNCGSPRTLIPQIMGRLASSTYGRSVPYKRRGHRFKATWHRLNPSAGRRCTSLLAHRASLDRLSVLARTDSSLIRKSPVRGQAAAPGAAQRSRVQAGRWVPARRRVPG